MSRFDRSVPLEEGEVGPRPPASLNGVGGHKAHAKAAAEVYFHLVAVTGSSVGMEPSFSTWRVV